MSDASKVQNEYGAEQIQVLEGLEPVRKRPGLSLIHISEPTRLGMISYAVFCLKFLQRDRLVGIAQVE